MAQEEEEARVEEAFIGIKVQMVGQEDKLILQEQTFFMQVEGGAGVEGG